MKQLYYLLLILVSILLLNACKNVKKKSSNSQSSNSIFYKCPRQCERTKTYPKKLTCPVCKMNVTAVMPTIEEKPKILTTQISENSIFNLISSWKTEENKTIYLKDLKGKALVIVMIYTSCKAACPRLVADMRNIAAKIPAKYTNELQYVLISIDPKNDTPVRLKEFAKENYMDGKQWTFLQGNKYAVREFANVLAVKYKQISPLDFSHSNIISIFNSQGELVHQQEGLGVDNKETVMSILKVLKD
ncbi:SCO family protein [Tenacibaculum aestuariivivum]|uniref:SCO family protein n=1 Tax=Tenacibaculum aestuariivivum TaxID=2006131 RepID=UPI003AB2A384